MTGRPTNRRTKEGSQAGGYSGRHALIPLLCILVISYASLAFALECRIPGVRGQSGKEIRVPLMIDETNNLAGMKLVLEYDKELLAFKEGGRSKATQSFMHIINDRTPGRLIVVMASANGIKGKEITLLTLTFTVKDGLKEKRTTIIEIPRAGQQFMSDDLKEIQYSVRSGTVEIMAAKPEDKKKGKKEPGTKTDRSAVPRK